MPAELDALCFAAADPDGLARFWSELLRWEPGGDPGVIVPTDDTGFRIRFEPTREPKVLLNLMHLELTSAYPEEQQQTVERALALGAQHLDVGQLPEEGHVVLADPEGNEFCVIPAGSSFLADCGFLGALSCDGSQAVGYFWSEALGWPLVWDQDEETAIRAPHGGPKVTWGGPPLNPRSRREPHFDLAPPPGGDQQEEVDRLVALGATVVQAAQGDGRVSMADPDGNAFCLLAPQER
jgi:predicted enzyme related to lactoylglutathione lyase